MRNNLLCPPPSGLGISGIRAYWAEEGKLTTSKGFLVHTVFNSLGAMVSWWDL